VIGGWLPEFLQKRKFLANILKKFDGIYVETNTMRTALEAQGFTNVFVMPNCKNLQILSEDELVYSDGAPLKLCTFSRVVREKGIEDAINAVRAVNETIGKTVYTLDIYGQVDATQTEWFDELQKSFPEYVSYKGCVDANKSVEVLKYYFALLFPTHYYTEGIPGTIIDAYAAGVPVISARWESFADIIDEKLTGIGYDFGNKQDLIHKLLD
jgi:glycosyltransferase involved in cell wall biosynthesis